MGVLSLELKDLIIRPQCFGPRNNSLCFFLSVFSVCVICLCFLSGFAFYRTTKNDTLLSKNFDSILPWSGLADQLLFADINSQFI